MATEDKTEDKNDLSYMDSHFEAAGIDLKDEANGSDTTSGEASTTSAAETSDQVKGADGKDSVSGDGDKSKQQGKEEKGKSADTSKPDALPAGALKLNDGTIIQPGQERRWFDNMQLARQQTTIAKNELNTANQNYNNLKTKYEALENSVKHIGLEKPEDVSTAVSLFKDLQRDVVGTLTKLLAEAKSKGYSIEGLGSTVDTAAITALLDRKLEPSVGDKQRQEQERIAQDLDKELNQFIQDFPDALVHEAYIASVIDEEAKAGRQVTLRDAMFALKEKVINSGLDWAQPLGPQLEARKKAPEQQQQDQRPRTPGKLPVGASEEIEPGKVFAADNDTSDAIVRAAMKEAGLRV